MITTTAPSTDRIIASALLLGSSGSTGAGPPRAFQEILQEAEQDLRRPWSSCNRSIAVWPPPILSVQLGTDVPHKIQVSWELLPGNQ